MTSNLMALTMMLLSGVLVQAPSVSIGDGVNPSFPTRLTIGDEYSIFLSNFPQVSTPPMSMNVTWLWLWKRLSRPDHQGR